MGTLQAVASAPVNKTAMTGLVHDTTHCIDALDVTTSAHSDVTYYCAFIAFLILCAAVAPCLMRYSRKKEMDVAKNSTFHRRNARRWVRTRGNRPTPLQRWSKSNIQANLTKRYACPYARCARIQGRTEEVTNGVIPKPVVSLDIDSTKQYRPWGGRGRGSSGLFSTLIAILLGIAAVATMMQNADRTEINKSINKIQFRLSSDDSTHDEIRYDCNYYHDYTTTTTTTTTTTSTTTTTTTLYPKHDNDYHDPTNTRPQNNRATGDRTTSQLDNKCGADVCYTKSPNDIIDWCAFDEKDLAKNSIILHSGPNSLHTMASASDSRSFQSPK